MLNAIDNDLALRCVKSIACDEAEVYWEMTTTLRASITNRMLHVMPSTESGMTVRVMKSGQSLVVQRNDLGLKEILKELDASDIPSVDFEPLSYLHWPHGEAIQRLSKIMGNRSFHYTDTHREYRLVSTDGRSGHGKEESATATCEQSGLKTRTVSGSIDRFWNTVDSWLAQYPRDSSRLGWPLPGGTISVLWSPQAFGNLVKNFLRHFESDRLLSGRSLLSQMQFPQPFRFDLVDSGHAYTDHEATKCKESILFAGGRPRALACNRTTAKELGVAPTGHCRRGSYHYAPTIGFWHPKIVGHQLFEDSLATLHNGLLVDDAALSEDERSIRILDATLIHQGHRGEKIDPSHLGLSLVELMASLEAFSNHTQTIGIEIEKDGQWLISDCEFPWALSPKIPCTGRGGVCYW